MKPTWVLGLGLALLSGSAMGVHAATPAEPAADEEVIEPVELEALPERVARLEERLAELFAQAKTRLDTFDKGLGDQIANHGELAVRVGTLEKDADSMHLHFEKLKGDTAVSTARVPTVRSIVWLALAAVAISALMFGAFVVFAMILLNNLRRDTEMQLKRAAERYETALNGIRGRSEEALDRALKSIETAAEAEATAMGLQAVRTELDGLRTELQPFDDKIRRLQQDLERHAHLEQVEKSPRMLLTLAETAPSHAEALFYLEQLLKVESAPDLLFSGAAVVHQQFKNIPLALQLYEKGLELAPARADVRAVYLSLLGFLPERRAEARKELMALAQKYRGDETVLASLFNFFIRAHDDEGYRDAAKALLKGSAGNAIIHRNMALALAKTDGSPEDIASNFEAAVRHDATSESLSIYTEWLNEQGQHDKAQAIVRAAVARHPRDFEARVLLGRCLFAAGLMSKARREYEKVLEKARDSDPISARAARLGIEELELVELDAAG